MWTATTESPREATSCCSAAARKLTKKWSKKRFKSTKNSPTKEKQLEEVSADEFNEIAHSVGLRRHRPRKPKQNPPNPMNKTNYYHSIRYNRNMRPRVRYTKTVKNSASPSVNWRSKNSGGKVNEAKNRVRTDLWQSTVFRCRRQMVFCQRRS